MKISKCEKEKFNGFETQFDNRNLSDFYCADSFETEIGGYIDEGECDYIQFDIFKCENKGSNPNSICRPIEEINKKIQNSFIYIYMQEAFSNLSDFHNPVKYL